MSGNLLIKTCPTCGSDKIQWIVKDVIRNYRGQTYIVPAVEYYECSSCGEKVYDGVAIRKIQAYSPAYRHQHVSVEA